ncbi:MFS transporter [Pseudoclavibacter sp. RFBJ3]|nr:MFS transporter [Pseudoclavibacter sp. AY1H1]PPF84051.1 MFS transporter [Pseudoclavibacter sp. RFBJ5]PPF92331.1 MFS transporter [Pseudoclavibacter sp. RFBJ3]PPF97194.1 MFS transporter [Pseudoclavibacter sp. RFBH5]PPG23586.1 MFS transporter [Pseudoclavibacter sp. RFBI4]
MFLTNGALFANLLPRYPGLKAELALSNVEFGLVVAAYPSGALLAGLAAAALIRRFWSSRLAVAGTAITSVALFAASFAPNGLLLAAAFAFGGAADALTDVAQNSHGLRVQRRFGRSIINGFHAIWSIGAVLGGLMGAAAVALQVPLPLHLGVSGALFTLVAVLAYRWMIPGPEHDDVEVTTAGIRVVKAGTSARGGSAKYLVLLALVLLTVAGSVVEDSGSTWAALYLSGSLEAPQALAAFGFIALVGAQFVGRMLGDRLVDRFGERRVAQAGGLVTALGMGVALLFPSVGGTIAGFAAAGLGIATLVPAALHAADELPGFKPGTAITLVSWLMRLGFLAAPPLVGLLADATSLRVGLIVVPIAGVVAFLCAGVLAGRTRRSDPTS